MRSTHTIATHRETHQQFSDYTGPDGWYSIDVGTTARDQQPAASRQQQIRKQDTSRAGVAGITIWRNVRPWWRKLKDSDKLHVVEIVFFVGLTIAYISATWLLISKQNKILAPKPVLNLSSIGHTPWVRGFGKTGTPEVERQILYFTYSGVNNFTISVYNNGNVPLRVICTSYTLNMTAKAIGGPLVTHGYSFRAYLCSMPDPHPLAGSCCNHPGKHHGPLTPLPRGGL